MRRSLALFAALLLAAAAPAADRSAERDLMVLTISNLAGITGASQVSSLDRDVLKAMRAVPRHLFVPEEVRRFAYQNRPLPIGHEQTISQPYIVGLMTHLLKPKADHVVLEVGTGSGYQAAVLAKLVRQVYTIEIVEPLAREAGARLSELGYSNVTVRAGDGYAGWPEHGPFDGIIVTAGAPHIPQPLVEQLKPGGRMVIPVSKGKEGEELTLVEKDKRGRVRTRSILPVRFVPLVRAPSP